MLETKSAPGILLNPTDFVLDRGRTNKDTEVLLGGGFKYFLCSPPFGEYCQVD